VSEDGGDTRVDLVNRLNAAIARIEELEATLREIAGGCLSSGNSWKTMRELARAALDKDAGE